MADAPGPQPVGAGSDALLDAYELVLEAIREGGGADDLLRRALAVVATIPWPARHRLFTAFVVDAETGTLRLAALVGQPAEPALHCRGVAPESCVCGDALASGRTVTVAGDRPHGATAVRARRRRHPLRRPARLARRRARRPPRAARSRRGAPARPRSPSSGASPRSSAPSCSGAGASRSTRTSRTASSRRRRWRPSGAWPAASRTTSTTSSPPSPATPSWGCCGSTPQARCAATSRRSSPPRTAPRCSPSSCSPSRAARPSRRASSTSAP